MIETDPYIAFFRAAGALKDMTRNSWSAGGRRESVAEHSWRLTLMALTLADAWPGLDHRRLLELLIVHDLGEAIRGDVLQAVADPAGHHVGGFDLGIAEVEHAEVYGGDPLLFFGGRYARLASPTTTPSLR